jgi:hypothetical protein
MARISAALTRKREELAWELRIQGMRERDIAQEIEKAGLGTVTQQAVSLMLTRLEARALKAMTDRVGGVKARQTDSLWLIFDEAMKAWERSKTANKSITKRIDSRGGRKPAADDSPAATGSEQVTTRIADQDGDPRFLDQARSALFDIRRIWGIDAPSKFAPTTPDGTEEYGKLNDEQRAAGLSNLLARLGQAGFGPLAPGNGHPESQSVERSGGHLPPSGRET